MEPQRQPQGQLRKIVGFHLDENLDWVAELECGHQQHVRPPLDLHGLGLVVRLEGSFDESWQHQTAHA